MLDRLLGLDLKLRQYEQGKRVLRRGRRAPAARSGAATACWRRARAGCRRRPSSRRRPRWLERTRPRRRDRGSARPERSGPKRSRTGVRTVTLRRTGLQTCVRWYVSRRTHDLDLTTLSPRRGPDRWPRTHRPPQRKTAATKRSTAAKKAARTTRSANQAAEAAASSTRRCQDGRARPAVSRATTAGRPRAGVRREGRSGPGRRRAVAARPRRRGRRRPAQLAEPREKAEKELQLPPIAASRPSSSASSAAARPRRNRFERELKQRRTRVEREVVQRRAPTSTSRSRALDATSGRVRRRRASQRPRQTGPDRAARQAATDGPGAHRPPSPSGISGRHDAAALCLPRRRTGAARSGGPSVGFGRSAGERLRQWIHAHPTRRDPPRRSRPSSTPSCARSIVELGMVRVDRHRRRRRRRRHRLADDARLPDPQPLPDRASRRPCTGSTASPTVNVGFDVLSDPRRARLQQQARPRRRCPRARSPQVPNVICIGSGKGGVGKSTLTANLAAALAAEGKKVGVLDADVWGYSIPRMFGLGARPARRSRPSARSSRSRPTA